MDDLSEKEQIEEIRKWWAEYGSMILGGIVVGVVSLGGWNYYSNARITAQNEASDLYESLATHVADGNLEDAETVVADLVTNYADTAYAGQAGLAVARLYMDKNRDQDASDALQTVIDSDADDSVKNVARLRLARVFLYQEKPQEVVDMISVEESEAFAAVFQEVLGDAYTALGQFSDAETAYQAALASPMGQGTIDFSLVQWKLLDLPQNATSEDVEASDEAVVEESE